jgi:N-acetyl-gamma-glutamyl-phosphate reductase
MVRARVIGAGGYGGAGIIDLLLAHPKARIADVVDVENVGAPISKKFPHFAGFCDLEIKSPDQAAWDGSIDVVFTATPDGVGARYAERCLAAGAKLIDFSGDFRFNSPEDYSRYAERIGRPPEHAAAGLLAESVYGLAELHRSAIASARLVGNPGCFAASVILGLAPAVQAGLVDLDSLIADAKTGVSGAGIKPAATFHYPSRYENMNAYKIARHQHCVEIERELGLLAGREINLTLTTQVVPLARGIMSTLYGRIKDSAITAADILNVYRDFYRDSVFVRLVGPDGTPSNNEVRGSNFCVLWINLERRTRQMIVVAHIDNLMKGQAGSALQNMNLMFGLEESAGLMRPAFYP